MRSGKRSMFHQAEDKDGEDHEGEKNVGAVALLVETEDGKRHAGDRRGDEYKQAELHPAAAVKRDGAMEDASQMTKRGRLAAKNAVIRDEVAVLNQVHDSANENDYGRKNDAGAKQQRNDDVHAFIGPAILALFHQSLPVKPLKSISKARIRMATSNNMRSLRDGVPRSEERRV